MSTIQFSNGHTVEFNGTPTQQDIEQLGQQMGLHSSTPQTTSPRVFAPGGSQFTQPTPAGATQMQYAPGSGTTTGSQFMGSLGSGVSQTAHSITDPIMPTFGNDISGAFSGGANQLKQTAGDINAGKTNPLQNAWGLAKGTSGILGSPFASAMKPINIAAQGYGYALGGIKQVQDFADSKAGQVTSKAAQFTADAANVAGSVGMFMGGPQIKAKIEPGFNAVAEAAKPGFKAVGEDIAAGAKKVTDVPGKIGQGLENRYVKQAQNEWTKPTTKPAGFKKATQIFNNAADKGHNIAETLVGNKLKLSDHISEGKYNTADTASNIRSDAMKASNDMLRPSLEKADAEGAPKTSISDLINTARQNIAKNKSLTQEMKDSLQGQLNKTELSLTKKSPQGLSLTDLHDEKIVRDMNSKYSPVGDIATNAEAIKNKAIADAARTTLEKTAPKDIPVKDFNAELSKQHQAANYLDALNGKKAPVSNLSKVANYGGKLAGLAAGSAAGGGILADVAGYHIGGLAERMIENMPNPLKNHFLDNLETTNPEAFTKIQEYLNRPTSELQTPTDNTPIPKEGSPEAIITKEGWKNTTDKTKFDSALMHKDFKTVQAMLPDVPEAYKAKFSKNIDALITKNPQAGFFNPGQMMSDIFGKKKTSFGEDMAVPKPPKERMGSSSMNMSNLQKELRPTNVKGQTLSPFKAKAQTYATDLGNKLAYQRLDDFAQRYINTSAKGLGDNLTKQNTATPFYKQAFDIAIKEKNMEVAKTIMSALPKEDPLFAKMAMNYNGNLGFFDHLQGKGIEIPQELLDKSFQRGTNSLLGSHNEGGYFTPFKNIFDNPKMAELKDQLEQSENLKQKALRNGNKAVAARHIKNIQNINKQIKAYAK